MSDLDLTALTETPKAEPVATVPTVLTKDSIGGLPVVSVQDKQQFINLIVYGESGVGKTRFAGSASVVPELAPVLFVDVEGGELTLAHSYPQAKVVRIKTWQELQNIYDELFRGEHGYKTIVIDSLTELQKFNMYGIMEDLLVAEPTRDPDIPGMREWGKSTEQIRKFVRAFRDLPINTVFTALTKEDRNPRTGISTKRPSLSGKLASEVPGFVDIVLYMYFKRVDDTVLRLLTPTSTDEVVAKDRTGKLPPVFGHEQEPTMATVYGFIQGSPNQPTN